MIADILDPTNPDRLFVATLGHPYGPNEERRPRTGTELASPETASMISAAATGRRLPRGSAETPLLHYKWPTQAPASEAHPREASARVGCP